jgi:hypothetical protein
VLFPASRASRNAVVDVSLPTSEYLRINCPCTAKRPQPNDSFFISPLLRLLSPLGLGFAAIARAASFSAVLASLPRSPLPAPSFPCRQRSTGRVPVGCRRWELEPPPPGQTTSAAVPVGCRIRELEPPPPRQTTSAAVPVGCRRRELEPPPLRQIRGGQITPKLF